ncbi:MAG: BON domain-containing protein [Steroidobacteraceae bacterium]|nr:BON domain-containing protein [Steroidobacteraceae bacterium]
MNGKMTSILASGLAALLVGGVAAAETTPPVQLAAEQPDDGAITEKVKAAIAEDAALAGADISVETVQGKVRLDGYVGNAGDIQKATALAFSVSGVKKVENNLKAM